MRSAGGRFGPSVAPVVLCCMALASVACSSGAPAASVGPAVSASPAESPRPRPSPTPKLGDLIVDRLVERITADDFSARVVIDAGVAVAGGTATFDATVDVDGPNSRARMKSVLEGSALDFEAIVVDGVSWTRLGKDAFARDRSYREAFTVDPFFHLGADPRRITYVRPAEEGGGELHDVRLDGAFLIHPVNLGPTNVSDARLQFSEFHLFLTEEGVPVGGSLRFIGKARVGRQLQELRIDATYEFSDVGGDVTVKAPS